MSAIATTLHQSPADEIVRARGDELTTRRKVLIGGLGALTPIILNLLVVDLTTTLAAMTAVVVLGYLLRVAVLFCIGGGMAYFHKEEKYALKLFEIGIVAPALITALMNGTTNIKNRTAAASADQAAVTASLDDFFVTTAHAQTKSSEIKTYSRSEESLKAQLWRGLSGAQDDREWFVVAGTYEKDDLQKARNLVRKIAQDSPEYKPQIYKNDKYYAVVLGANLTLAQAKTLKGTASKAGVPTDGEMYLYNPWESK